MANLNSDRYLEPVQKPAAGVLAVAYGTVTIPALETAADTHTWFTIPQDVVVLDGWLRGDDIDTDAGEAYDIDIGIATDTDKYLNGGTLTGDAVTDVKPVGILARLNQNTVAASSAVPFPAATTEEETILTTVVTAATAGGTGSLGLMMWYTAA